MNKPQTDADSVSFHSRSLAHLKQIIEWILVKGLVIPIKLTKVAKVTLRLGAEDINVKVRPVKCI